MFTRNGMAALASLLLIVGCNNEQLPEDAELRISPDVRTYEITELTDENGRCLLDPGFFIDMTFVVRLAGAESGPVGDVELNAYLDLGANTFSGYPVLELYEDRNNNGVVDADTELVSAQDDGVAVFRTDDVSGAHHLLVRANISCGYRGELFVYGNGVSASAQIEIVARQAQDPSEESESTEGTEDAA